MDDDLEQLYLWMDSLPLSRPKKNISRDFSDGVLMAEVLKYFYPRIVDLHNYYPGSSIAHKLGNWTILNKKVLTKIGLRITVDQQKRIATATPDAILELLFSLRKKVCDTSKGDQEKSRTEAEGEKCVLGRSESQENRPNHDDGKEQIEKTIHKEQTGYENAEQEGEVNEGQMLVQEEVNKNLAEIARRDDVIMGLKRQITHMSELMKLKDQRINDLTQQLQISKGRKKSITIIENS